MGDIVTLSHELLPRLPNFMGIMIALEFRHTEVYIIYI